MEETPQPSLAQPPQQKQALTVPAAIIVAGALIAIAVFAGLSRGTPLQPKVAPEQQQQATIPVDIKKVKTQGDAFVGNPNAPVTVAYWFDYQCPFCKRFEDDSITQIMKEYVATGKVKLVFKNYQFLGPDSMVAGLASEAVWEMAPDKFYTWHEAMFAKQDDENGGWGNKADILALTKTTLGAETAEKVENLMASKEAEYTKLMDEDKNEGTGFGINGTPGAIIGKTLVQGAQPYASVKKLIDAELAK